MMKLIEAIETKILPPTRLRDTPCLDPTLNVGMIQGDSSESGPGALRDPN
jgi:hypothetical protein